MLTVSLTRGKNSLVLRSNFVKTLYKITLQFLSPGDDRQLNSWSDTASLQLRYASSRTDAERLG